MYRSNYRLCLVLRPSGCFQIRCNWSVSCTIMTACPPRLYRVVLVLLLILDQQTRTRTFFFKVSKLFSVMGCVTLLATLISILSLDIFTLMPLIVSFRHNHNCDTEPHSTTLFFHSYKATWQWSVCVCNSIVEVMNVHSLYMLLSPVCSARHQTGDIEMICLQKNKSFLVLVYKATLMCELLAPNSQKNVKQKNKSTVFVFMEPNCHFFWWHNVYKWYLGGISLCATHILSRLNGDTSSSSSSSA